MATFNVVEACVRTGVSRLVFISSETVPGFIFAERPFLPACLPVDEAHRAQLRTPTTWPRRSGSRSSPTCPAGTCTRRGGRRTRTPRPSCAPCRVGTPPAYPPARPRSCWAGEPPARGATTSPRRGNPSRVATAETQRPVQRRGFLGDGHRLVEDAHAPALLGGLGDEPVGHLGGVVVNAVVLAGCSRQVPAVDDQVCGEHGRGEPGRHLRRSNPDGLR